MIKRIEKIIKKIFKFSFIIILFAFAGSILYYFLYLNFDEKISCRITEDVTQINDLISSIYLIKSDSGYIAFDAGFDEKIIRRGLKFNNLKPGDIKYLFLTHTDADHQRAINLFQSSKIFIPGKEVQMIKDHIPRFAAFPYLYNEININNYELIKENMDLFIGGRHIKCISLAGHTDGSMGYIVDNKYLFSGDAFRLKNGRLAEPYLKYFTMNLNTLKKTINHMADYHNIKYIFTSHSGFTADFKFAVDNSKYYDIKSNSKIR